ncbi:hypothetical protein [Mycoplasmopsis columboralis]|uniref:Uncharacterized protein n=1 Tax=Mycoplasmopsis columboralis TaxID=171282 RepID=A0A449B638_9BACT|nr:hypothetical protein [Mycoplasmopsis columboralis]VEU76071.1 Uncharacterised protein [Mycoplasmopsis columboralis]
MQEKLFSVYSIERKSQKQTKYFMTLFDIDEKIFFIELVDDLASLGENEAENAIKIFSKSKMSNWYCDLNVIYMSDKEEFSNFAKNINKDFLLTDIDDIFKLSVLTKINEIIQKNDQKVNLIYLKNNLTNANISN